MKKVLWLSALAMAVMAIPSLVRAAENNKKNDEVVVTTALETVR